MKMTQKIPGSGNDNDFLEINGSEKVEVILKFGFTSARKRMSVVVRDQNGDIYLITKGADDQMRKMISEPFSQQLEHNLQIFADQGLRCLAICRRKVEQAELDDFLPKWIRAS